MTQNDFPDSAVHDARLNTGLIAWNLEGRLALAAEGVPVPDLAPEGVNGGCSTRLAILALEIAAIGSEIEGGSYVRPEALAALRRIKKGAAAIIRLATAARPLGT